MNVSDAQKKMHQQLRQLTPYERWEMTYKIWIEDDPWRWEYRLIHGAEF